MKASVIIPNYNHASYLEERIESVLNQTYQDFEVILLDDNSTDDSIKIIERYRNHPKVKRIEKNEKNTGNPFKQWAKGIELAEGEYVWIAESDDVASIYFLEELISFSELHATDMTYCRSALIDHNSKNMGLDYWPDALDGDRWNQSFVSEGSREVINYMMYRNTIVNASSVIFKKDVFPTEFLSLIQNFKYYGDWVIWNLIALKGKVGYISQPLNYFRRHSTSIFSRIKIIKEKRVMFKEAQLIIDFLKKNRNISSRQVQLENYKWIVDAYLEDMTKFNFWKSCFLSPPFKGALAFLYYKRYINQIYRKGLTFFLK